MRRTLWHECSAASSETKTNEGLPGYWIIRVLGCQGLRLRRVTTFLASDGTQSMAFEKSKSLGNPERNRFSELNSPAPKFVCLRFKHDVTAMPAKLTADRLAKP